jgi:PKD repeat protein
MSTYTDLGWDFAVETVNGTDDLWNINGALNNGYAYISDLEWSLENGELLADFSAVPTSGHVPLTVSFFDGSVSENTILSWQWDFENDGVIDSYEQNPVWIYQGTGIYSVNLTVYDDTGRVSATELKEDYIEVLYPLVYGDINDNGEVESYDASLILMYIVGLDPVPEDPLPWEEWRIERADVDLDGAVNALDAAYILQYVVQIITEFPVINGVRHLENVITLPDDDE